jgi:hypothetical protein
MRKTTRLLTECFKGSPVDEELSERLALQIESFLIGQDISQYGCDPFEVLDLFCTTSFWNSPECWYSIGVGEHMELVTIGAQSMFWRRRKGLSFAACETGNISVLEETYDSWEGCRQEVLKWSGIHGSIPMFHIVRQPDFDDIYVAMIYAIMFDNREFLQFLISMVPADMVRRAVDSCLSYASIRGRRSIVTMLLQDNPGDSRVALQFACQERKFDIVHDLISAGYTSMCENCDRAIEDHALDCKTHFVWQKCLTEIVSRAGKQKP